MQNRKIAPPIYEITHLQLPTPQKMALDNGMPVYVLHYPGQSIVKIETVFRAGRLEEHKPQVARATLRLVREGTPGHSSAEIAETIDFYGGSLSLPTSFDTSNCILFTLKKYAARLIPLMGEMLQAPLFPESELETFSRNAVQDLAVELEKGEVITYRQLTENIFGPQHPYGYNSVPEHFTALQRSDLELFFHQWYNPHNALMVISGDVDDELLQLVNRELGTFRRAPSTPLPYPEPAGNLQPFAHIEQKDALQTAIKLGRKTFNRSHPHYAGLYVLNTVLGGYFGSRLMTNIREKHGFTYNVYSSADTLQRDGYLYIAAEVNTGTAGKTLREIYREMDRLRREPIPESELAMVRNYLLGALLNGLDGPLNSSDLVKTMLAENLSWEAFDNLVHTIKTISAREIKDLAAEYLDPSGYCTVIAGPETAKQAEKFYKSALSAVK